MPAQISFPILDRCRCKQTVGCFEKIGLMHIDVARRGQTDFLKVIRPTPIRRDALKFLRRHFVVILLRIAQLHSRARSLGQRSFKLENFLRIAFRIGRRLAGERQHLAHVRDVRVPQFLRSLVIFRVVIAVGHPESALHRLRDLMRAVLVVLARTEIEKRVHADHVQMRDLLQHIMSIFHVVDLGQLVLQRLGLHCVDRLFIHPARVVITDLLHFRRDLWIGFGLGRFFRNHVQRVVVVLDQLIETAPARIFRRNFSALDPTAVRVKKEIVRRFYRLIHVARIDRLDVGVG